MKTSTQKGMQAASAGVLTALCITFVASGCYVTQQASLESVKKSGFLGDYSRLTPGNTEKGQALLRYLNPAANWRQYNKVIIDPVTFWGDDKSKISPDTQLALTTYFHAALEKDCAGKLQVVDQPGPGVMKLQVAITDAESATPVLRTVSLVVPQARVLGRLGSLVTGSFAFSGEAQVEARLTDASTGQTLAEVVDKRLGGNNVKAAAQWQWGDAENAMDAWAQMFANRVYAWTTGAAAPGDPPPSS
jgi:hypothetical protein